MRKIIDGKSYDTETATLLAEYEYGLGTYEFLVEQLYVTKKGAYFLFYKGGAMSKYGESLSKNEHSEGSGIKLLTREEASEFMEKYASAEDYEQHFGTVEEG